MRKRKPRPVRPTPISAGRHGTVATRVERRLAVAGGNKGPLTACGAAGEFKGLAYAPCTRHERQIACRAEMRERTRGAYFVCHRAWLLRAAATSAGLPRVDGSRHPPKRAAWRCAS